MRRERRVPSRPLHSPHTGLDSLTASSVLGVGTVEATDTGAARFRRHAIAGETDRIRRHGRECRDCGRHQSPARVLQVPQRVKQQAGPDQQQRGKRHLPGDQHFRSIARSPTGHRCRARPPATPACGSVRATSSAGSSDDSSVVSVAIAASINSTVQRTQSDRLAEWCRRAAWPSPSGQSRQNYPQPHPSTLSKRLQRAAGLSISPRLAPSAAEPRTPVPAKATGDEQIRQHSRRQSAVPGAARRGEPRITLAAPARSALPDTTPREMPIPLLPWGRPAGYVA